MAKEIIMLSPIAANLGAGSGIDTASLVNDLAAASRTPKIRRFEALALSNQAKISALGQTRSDLDSFASSLSNVVAGGTLRSQPIVSDATAVSVTIGSGVRIGALSAQLEIIQLAQTQSIYSDFISSANDAVGQGGLTLTVGSIAYNVTIDSSNDSLIGLAAAINAAGSNVQASIITDAAGSRIVLKGESGASNAFTFDAQIGADPALGRFTYGISGGQMTLGKTAADAQFKIDGVAYTRPTNTAADVITGVNLVLKKAEAGTVISLGSSRALDNVRQTINDFVSVFNSMKTNIISARNANGGDYALRKLDQQITSMISKAITSHTSINSLSDIGIATNRDGTISLDPAKLEAALAVDPDAVEALFNPTRDAAHSEATDPGISLTLNAIKDSATAAKGTLDGLRSRLAKEADAIAANRTKTEAREDAYRSRLEKQFGSMDTRIAALRATQSYLEQQVEIWSNSN
jgi:flagellar hook-associated protein 2